MCPACKAKVKISYICSPRNQNQMRKIVYTNGKGEECLFVAKVATKS